MSWWRAAAVAAPALALALVSIPKMARAHHPTSTGRVGQGGTATAASVGSRADDTPPPRLDMTLAYELLYFGRLLEGRESFDVGETGQAGEVVINALTLGASLELASGLLLAASLPVGVATITSSGGADQSEPGLGDSSLEAGWRWGAAGGRLELAGRVGVVLPTGRYEPEDALSVTDVVGGDDGSIALVTYNTRASLGAGAWSPTAALGGRFRAGERVDVRVAAALAVPVSDTTDGIRWGPDVTLMARTDLRAAGGGLVVSAGPVYRFHGRDRVQFVDADTEAVERERVGGRNELGLAVGVSGRLTSAMSCGVDVHVPLLQDVGGVQLTETASGSLRCSIAFGL